MKNKRVKIRGRVRKGSSALSGDKRFLAHYHLTKLLKRNPHLDDPDFLFEMGVAEYLLGPRMLKMKPTECLKRLEVKFKRRTLFHNLQVLEVFKESPVYQRRAQGMLHDALFLARMMPCVGDLRTLAEYNRMCHSKELVLISKRGRNKALTSSKKRYSMQKKLRRSSVKVKALFERTEELELRMMESKILVEGLKEKYMALQEVMMLYAPEEEVCSGDSGEDSLFFGKMSWRKPGETVQEIEDRLHRMALAKLKGVCCVFIFTNLA